MADTLVLNLKTEYFNQIQQSIKTEEYREFKDYWIKRIEGKHFEKIVLKKGYPKKENTKDTITRVWKGYSIKIISHPQFNNKPTKVYAIKV